MTNKTDKVVKTLKELNVILKELKTIEGTHYHDELLKLDALNRSPNGVNQMDFRSLNYELDNITLGLVLSILQAE